MEVVDTRQSVGLPSISFLDIDKIKREEAEYQRKNTATAMVSPSFPYSCPPPPYGHPPAGASSPSGPPSGLISPPESRRTSGDDPPLPLAPPAATRQSLPSISEAIGPLGPPAADTALRYPPLTPTTAAPASTPAYSQPTPTTSFTDPIRTSYPADPPRSEPSHPQPPPRSPYMSHSSQSFQTGLPPQSEAPRPSYYTPSEPKLPTLHPINTAESPVSQIRPGPSYPQQPQTTYEPTPQSAPATAPYPYSQQYPSPYQYPPPPPTSNSGPVYPPSGVLSAPPRYGGGWSSEMDRHAEERRGAGRVAGPAYGEAVKRHLDTFDLEASLNEVAESSGRLLEFSRVYGDKAHHSQRSGPIPESIPNIKDVEDLLQKSQKITSALVRIKEVVNTQTAAFAEQQKDSNQQAANGYGPEANGYPPPEDSKGSGGFAGPDPKKRRGRAAPPGRCHSCNRAETPEWRRGPDGARTLCNACGLHYAKLTRKVGANKAQIGSSNLRPKGPGSPTT